MVDPYIIVLGIGVLVLGWTVHFLMQHKKRMSEMCCMSAGMAIGMTSGFFIGAIYDLMTGHFLGASIVGTVAGTAVGYIVGNYGGTLARTEGVMAGPMGGLMGAMFAHMLVGYNLKITMIFLVSLTVFLAWQIVSMTHTSTRSSMKLDKMFLGMMAIGMIALTGFLSYGETGSSFALAKNEINENANWDDIELKAGEVKTALSPNGASQDIEIVVDKYGYTPEVIVAKKGVPLTMHMNLNEDAGCGNSFVITQFGIRRNLQAGDDHITFTPTTSGTIPFSCAMGMMRGTIKVV